MNNVYLTCKVINIEDICFDYYEKLKPYCILKCIDLDDNSNIFNILLYDKVYINLVNNIILNSIVFITGRAILSENKLYILAKDMKLL